MVQISAEIDARNMARLAAVQALYQMEHSAGGVASVVREFQEHRLGSDLDGDAIRDADSEFFEQVVRGVVDLQDRIDPFVNRFLRTGWSLKRLDATVRAILRCSAFELIHRPDIPYRSVIDQYVELTGSFFESGSEEAAFVNAVLDQAAREVRSDEFSDAG